jgi:uncharacterized damage-inducible protein DinB
MRSPRLSLPLPLLAALLVAGSAAHAQNAAAPASAAPAAPTSGLKAEIVAQIDEAGSKLVQLAEATPQNKFAYRPAAGVRSTSEVFMHVVNANYMLPGIAGTPKPTDVKLTPDMEKTVTDKTQIVELLRKSFAHVRAAAMAMPDEQMDAKVNLFGEQATKRAVLLLIATHAHEHLGQSIAYARANGIVPPWSRGQAGN